MTSLIVATALAMNTHVTQQNDPPSVSLRLKSNEGMSGGPVEGVITLTFADGLHGYQNPPSQDYQIPVSVSSGSTNVQIIQVDYPMGEPHKVGGETEESFTYSGVVEIPVLLKVVGKAGDNSLSLKVRYQQCTNTMCFAPTSISANAKFKVKPLPKGWNTVARAAFWAKSQAGRN